VPVRTSFPIIRSEPAAIRRLQRKRCQQIRGQSMTSDAVHCADMSIWRATRREDDNGRSPQPCPHAPQRAPGWTWKFSAQTCTRAGVTAHRRPKRCPLSSLRPSPQCSPACTGWIFHGLCISQPVRILACLHFERCLQSPICRSESGALSRCWP